MDLKQVKSALEEHLNSINDNSSEIQALFDYIQQVELKIDKVSQRLDQLQLSKPEVDVSPLNHVERKAFLVLYTEEAPLTFKEIAAKAELPEAMIPECVSSLVHKGIPLQRSYFKDQLFFQLRMDFKEKQAKENVVNLSLQSFIE